MLPIIANNFQSTKQHMIKYNQAHEEIEFYNQEATKPRKSRKKSTVTTEIFKYKL